jgi:phosphoribosylformylglycinamidine synthase
VVGSSFFGDKSMQKKKFTIPVAHGYGKYVVSKNELENLERNGQIFLRYIKFNPNGSVSNIAGIRNTQKTIFGMMPHLERSPDSKYFMRAIEKYVATN